VRLVDITSKSEVWIILVGPDGTEAVLKIYETEKLALSPKPCGTVVTDGKSHLYIYIPPMAHSASAPSSSLARNVWG
jgi:hypothetical protein